jgi:hypothetical protein
MSLDPQIKTIIMSNVSGLDRPGDGSFALERLAV